MEVSFFNSKLLFLMQLLFIYFFCYLSCYCCCYYYYCWYFCSCYVIFCKTIKFLEIQRQKVWKCNNIWYILLTIIDVGEGNTNSPRRPRDLNRFFRALPSFDLFPSFMRSKSDTHYYYTAMLHFLFDSDSNFNTPIA